MVQYANIALAPQADGILYASAVNLTSIEADLYNGKEGDPIPVVYGVSVLAIIQLTATGEMGGNSSYVVMQTDLAGNGIWVDTNWTPWTGISGTALFCFSNGVAGANTFQQSRAPGTAPGSAGSNQLTLGGRIRFVGKASITSGSSVSSVSSGASGYNSVGQVKANIWYKITGNV